MPINKRNVAVINAPELTLALECLKPNKQKHNKALALCAKKHECNLETIYRCKNINTKIELMLTVSVLNLHFRNSCVCPKE